MMQCSCGAYYFDDAEYWMVLSVHNGWVSFDHSGYHVVYASRCPKCSGVIVKTRYFMEREFGPFPEGHRAGSFSPTKFLVTDYIKSAAQIYPISQRGTRREIPLDGVPDFIRNDYRIALKVLDDSDTFPYANVLARRALETALSKYRNLGDRVGLAALIDRLLADSDNGLSRPLLNNLDAVRRLGDMEAHHFTDSSGQVVEVTQRQTEWNVSILERFLQEWYVRPAQDAAFRAEIEGQLSTLSNADSRPLKKP